MKKQKKAEEKKRIESLKELLQIIGKEDKPLNVAIIGMYGSGKSSFVNTLIAGITGEWRNYAMVGCLDGLRSYATKHFAIQWKGDNKINVTTLLSNLGKHGSLDITEVGLGASEEYRKKKYLKHARDVEHLMKYNFPTILDMPGFYNINDKETRILLDLVFSGRVPEDSYIFDIQSNIRRLNEEQLNNLYPPTRSNMRVDRIIFVVSASNPNLPDDLLQAVHSSRKSGQRDIPLFGILTKIDDPFTSEDKLQEFISRLGKHLGIEDKHLLECTNYCDLNLEEIKNGIRDNLPGIDTDVLLGMKQVLEPSLTVPEHEKSTTNPIDARIVLMLAFVTVVTAIFMLLLWK